MRENGQWYDSKHTTKRYFLCQGKTLSFTENAKTSIELEKEQLAFLPFHVVFKRAANKMSNTSQGEKRRTSGFTLNWFLKDSRGIQVTENLPPRQEDWKQSYATPDHRQPLLLDMVQLAKEVRLQNISKEEILITFIQKKSQKDTMPEIDEACSMEQVKEGQYQDELFSKVL